MAESIRSWVLGAMTEFCGNQYTSVGGDGEWTESRLLEAVQALAAELGRPPTTKDAIADDRFPGVTRLYRVIDDWPALLDKAGINPTRQQRRSQPADRQAAMRSDLQRVARAYPDGILTTRQYDVHGAFATSSVKERFGSWTAACAAAGISSGEKHGRRCQGPRGEELSSLHKQAVAVALYERGVEYEPHPSVPDTKWVADFYLPTADLWLEVDGYAVGTRPNEESFAEKLEYYSENGFRYAVVSAPADTESACRVHGIDIG